LYVKGASRMEELRILTSPFSGERLLNDLKKKLDETKIDANNIFLFTTRESRKYSHQIMKLLKEKYPHANMTGCHTEGYMTRDAVWTKGAAIILIDSEKVNIAHASGKSTEKVFSRLNKKVRAKKKVAIFPLVYVPNLPNIMKLFAYDKFYYNLKYKRAKTIEEKKIVLHEYSKILESKTIYPVNIALKQLDGEVAGVNLVPLTGGYRSPTVYINFTECHRCCVCVGIKGRVHMHFHDVFPERGDSFEETLEILKDYFGKIETVETVSKDIAIGEVNGKTAVNFLKEKTRMPEIRENDIKNVKLRRDALPLVSPYGLGYISKITHGCSMIGLQPYPINIYPSIFNLDNFYETCIFTGEVFRGGIYDFFELYNNIKNQDTFLLFIIDSNVIPMFSRKIHILRQYINEKLKNKYLGIISSFPSFKSYKLKKKCLTEIDKGVYFNGTGTSFIMEISDIQVL